MFCERCGRNLEEEDSFCPECGYPVRGQGVGTATATHYERPVSDSLLTVATVMLGLYAAFAILMGLMLLTMGDSTISVIEQNPEQFEGFGVTAEQVREALPIITTVFLASGAAAAISLYFCITRTRHTAAVVLTVVSSSMLLTYDFMGFVIGVLVAFFIFKSKVHFSS